MGLSEESSWRLIVKSEEVLHQQRYMTISHRWSSKPLPKLSDSNIDSFRQGLPVAILPKAFQDAITVVRYFGIRYLWVDSLCILQDSEIDWQRESSQMSAIYGNSLCNISATGSTDNATGFFASRNPNIGLPCRVHPVWAEKLEHGFTVLDSFIWWSQVLNTALMKRGWVFQERLLAPTVLHFGENQLFFECRELDACETYPYGLPETLTSPGHAGFKKAFGALFDTTDKAEHLGSRKPVKDLAQLWCNLVQAYTRTQVTRSKDKLIALAGVTQIVEASFKSDYLAGLWHSHLVVLLEWHADIARRPAYAEVVKPAEYRAPSWSWAAVDGRVFYDYAPHSLVDYFNDYRKPTWTFFMSNDQDDSRFSMPVLRYLGSYLLASVLTAKVSTPTEYRLGQVTDGRVEMQSRCIHAYCIRMVDNLCRLQVENGSPVDAIVYPDVPSDNYGGAQVNLLALRVTRLMMGSRTDPNLRLTLHWLTGLVLQLSERSPEGSYVRIGFFCVKSQESLESFGVDTGYATHDCKLRKGVPMQNVVII